MEYRRRTLNTAFDEENQMNENILRDYSIEEHTYYQYHGIISPWRIVCNGLWYSVISCGRYFNSLMYNSSDDDDESIYKYEYN
jgi:hypothetical protein